MLLNFGRVRRNAADAGRAEVVNREEQVDERHPQALSAGIAGLHGPYQSGLCRTHGRGSVATRATASTSDDETCGSSGNGGQTCAASDGEAGGAAGNGGQACATGDGDA